MFTKRPAPPAKRIDSLIGAGTSVQGNLAFAGGLRIDGEVRGDVSAIDGEAATLVVSEKARVEGRIEASHLVVNGTVTGPVVAHQYLELQAKARVTGDVSYRTLEMHVGALVEGRLQPLGAEPAAAAVVELKRVGGG